MQFAKQKIHWVCLLILFFMMPIFASDPLWSCTARNSKAVHWYQYGKTQIEAKSMALRLCRTDSKLPCDIVCMPPRIYYRCLSHDTPTQPTEKRSTWYWSSYSQTVATHGALDACRHNSAVGGCYVNPEQCASS